jgi:predicted CXXCH cytochrome family protein
LTRAAEHPVELAKDADCASCHEDKSKGKHVHSAVAMGCTSCHEVKTENGTSTVNLISPKNELCFTCHEKAKEAVLHGPYEKGNCVMCHDPHTSDNEKQLRAAGNKLCQECHLGRGGDAATLKIFDKYEMKSDEFYDIPKLALDREQKKGHPVMAHPVAGVVNPAKPNETISCLTCHQQHASKVENLVRMDKPQDDFCGSCHTILDKGKTAKNEAYMKEHPDTARSELAKRIAQEEQQQNKGKKK